jgi:zinc protease
MPSAHFASSWNQRLVRTALTLATVAGLATILAPVGSAPVRSASAQTLPTDARLVTGELPNGLKYIVVKHALPPGRATVWMHVSTGSLNETDRQRGIAHYLEHMAFNGSANFPPNSVVPFFQSLGLSFGIHQNAFTSFDQTTYQLALPDTKAESIDKALLFFSDVAFRQSLLPHEIDEERQIILEEKRSRLGAEQRVRDYIFERIAPGSIFGQRQPIGTEETLLSMQEPDFRAYYSKWYVPSNITIMVVADAEPQGIIDAITKQFGEGAKVAKPVDQDAIVKPLKESRAIVATDAELSQAELSISRIEPPRPSVTTVPQYRTELVDNLSQAMFNRRMDKKISDGGMKMLQGGASVIQLASALRISDVQASGAPGDWKAMLTELATELQRARKHGFTQKELDEAKAEILSGAERGVQVEPTLPAQAIIGRINRAVAVGEPVMSAAQRLEVIKSVLPGIELKEVSFAFTNNFDPSAVNFILQAPTSGDVPSEADLVKIGTEALKVDPAADVETAGAKSLMDTLPTAGKVAESSVHEASGVWSGWLDNGIRVHHRFMDYRKNNVSISITFAGGEVEETAANRGITDAASILLDKPATSKLSSTEIRDLMTGKKINVGGGAGRDTVSVSIGGDPAELETGLQLAHLVITDGKIEKAAFDQWVSAQKQEIAGRKKSPQGVFQEALSSTIAPKGDIRFRPLEVEEVTKLKREDAQAWVDRIMKTAPAEITIVGDLGKDEAIELVSRYFGSLPKRERISTKTLANLRDVKRPVGPLVNNVEMATQTPVSIVLSGFFGADQQNVTDVRLLQLASRIMSSRMIKAIREEEQLVYSISATNVPGTDYPGYGLFFAAAPTEPGKVEKLTAKIASMYTDFATTGPTEEEMATVRKQIANTLDEQMKEPNFWSSRTANMEYRGTKLDDAIEAPAAYQAITAEQIKTAFAKYYTPEGAMTLSIKPKAAPAPEAPAAPASPSPTK